MGIATMTTEGSMFDRPIEVPEELRELARKKGWPEEIVERALRLSVSRYSVEWWLTHDRPTVEEFEKFLERRALLMFGTMRVREATWADDEALADLYANSPEEIGDWEVTVERSPYPFAQFRLQEHASITVLEDRGIILAATADSSRNTLVGGKRTTVHIASAWRVRKEFRGMGYSHLLRTAAGPACAWFGMHNYYYIRSQNFGALGWIQSFLRDSVQGAPEREGDVPGIPVTVYHFTPAPFTVDRSGIRLASRSDLRRCLSLINRSHRGCDLFRPYTQDFLEQRLDDPSWGGKPEFWHPVYGWPDYWVLEEAGQVVACAGLWDKGKNVREVWRHKVTGEQQVFEGTALMDSGYAEDKEEAMARLLEHLIGLTYDLGRSYLVAAIEHLPRLVERLERLGPTTETRALHWQVYDQADDRWRMDANLATPYTDLAYW